MAGLSDPLVREASPMQAGTAKVTLRRTLLVAALLGVMTCLLCAGAPRSFHLLALYSGQLPDTETTGADRHWLQCVLNTGGTCNFWPCHADRGPTECKWFIFGYHCMCRQGSCSGLDGKCGPTPNRVVAESVRFKNAQWPEYNLYLDFSNDIGVTVDRDDPAAKWNLLELPSEQEMPMQYKHFMLGNVQYPSLVATTVKHKQCDTCRGQNGDDVDCNCRHYWSAQGSRVSSMSTDVLIRLSPVPWAEHAFTLSTVRYPDMNWVVMPLSFGVTTVFGQAGPQGFWIPDPPLNASTLL